jgi:hypothetical protein
MKKFIKDYWFSLCCFLLALGILLFICIYWFIEGLSDDFITSLLFINCLSPIILLIIIGGLSMPRKEKGNEIYKN